MLTTLLTTTIPLLTTHQLMTVTTHMLTTLLTTTIPLLPAHHHTSRCATQPRLRPQALHFKTLEATDVKA